MGVIGHEFLDALSERSEALEVIGLNSVALTPQRERCERFYLVSETESELYGQQFYEIVEHEQPDLIVAGRDEDAL